MLWETFSERLLSHLARSPREWPLKLSREQSLSFNKAFLCPVRAVLPNCQGVRGLVCLSARWDDGCFEAHLVWGACFFGLSVLDALTRASTDGVGRKQTLKLAHGAALCWSREIFSSSENIIVLHLPFPPPLLAFGKFDMNRCSIPQKLYSGYISVGYVARNIYDHIAMHVWQYSQLFMAIDYYSHK